MLALITAFEVAVLYLPDSFRPPRWVLFVVLLLLSACRYSIGYTAALWRRSTRDVAGNIVFKILDHRQNRIRRGLPQPTNRRQRHRLREFLNQRQIRG